MIRGVIFDLDGVLVSSDHYHTAAWQEICDRWGIPFAEETAERLRGISRLNSAKMIIDHSGMQLTDTEIQEFANEKNKIYVQAIDEMTEADVIEGVPALLQLLQMHSFPMAVASSSKNAKQILKKTGLSAYFSVIIDGNQITRSKPDPQVFQMAADALGIPYRSCLVVEDAVSGIQAASALGCYTALIGKAGAVPGVTYRINAVGELSAIFEKMFAHHMI